MHALSVLFAILFFHEYPCKCYNVLLPMMPSKIVLTCPLDIYELGLQFVLFIILTRTILVYVAQLKSAVCRFLTIFGLLLVP